MFYYLLFLNINYPEPMIKFLEVFKAARLDFIPNPLESVVVDEVDTLPSPKNFNDNEFSGTFL